MGLLDLGLRGGFGFVSGGMSELAGEDSLANIPIVGGLLGAKSDEEKALEKKQQQLAAEAEKRRGQVRNQQMNQTAQRLGAFSPLNQSIAQALGPGAAFTPEQFAQMAQDPMGAPKAEDWMYSYQGNNPEKRAQMDAWAAKVQEYQANERKRREMVMSSIQQPGPGPAPLARPMTAAPAKRY